MSLASFIAGESISAGNAVYVDASGFLYKAIATNQLQASVIGVSLDTSQQNNLVRVATDFIYSSSSSLTPGELRYLSVSTSGNVVPYSTWQTELNASTLSGAFLTRVGRALTSTDIDIEVQKPIYVIK